MKRLVFGIVFVTFLCQPSWSQDPFWWGVGHAAFQVEGEPGPSDWLIWTRKPGKIVDGTNADVATEFWKHPERDFALAKELGAKMFRLSIAWERVQPRRNKWDEAALARYEEIIVSLRAHGLEPLVTLHHFVNPLWVAADDGFLSPTFAKDFAVFAKKVVARLSQPPAKVRWWMTFNEPVVVAGASYVTGEWPPGIKDDMNSAVQATAAMATAHIRALRKIEPLRKNLDLKIGVAAHLRDFQGAGDSWINNQLASVVHWSFNKQFLDAVTTGTIYFWVPGATSIMENEPLPTGRPGLDYLGVNYYGRTLVSLSTQPPFVHTSEGPGERSDVNWEIYPAGLGKVLRTAHADYKLPILVSENGVADRQDRRRPEFLRSHVRELINVRNSGIPVIGYLHWSLTDNFEWANGQSARFGLVDFDYATGRRTPRPSFYVFKEIIAQNGQNVATPANAR